MRETIRSWLSRHANRLYLLLAVIAFLVGYQVRGRLTAPPPSPAATEIETHDASGMPEEEPKPDFWTCSMHPQIHQPGPGKCPICGMDLIPVFKSQEQEEKEGPPQITISEAAKKLAEIVTAPVTRRFVTKKIRMVGKIDYDETRIRYITAWVPGRLDRLYVDYTGVTVKQNDHLVYLYSPDLLAAQEELIQAKRAVEAMETSNLGIMRETALATLEAAREKLRLLGLTPAQVERVERTGIATDHLTIYAPMGGIVIHKNAVEGMYVNTGTRIYTIADLSHLWVRLDAYESDLQWLRYGQPVAFTTEAYPGEVFEGRISFIDPVLDEKTRTVKVRVNVENPHGKLKPGMFVRSEVHAKIAGGGKVMEASLSGKWICPMHPEVIEKHPGKCPVCGMELVSTESLGYVVNARQEASLVVPASAVLVTGKRAVVYVEVPGRKMPTYEGREIVLGPRAEKDYIVYSGLSEGERVVVNGNFKLDSALQIQAKPSMMSPEGGAAPAGHAHHGGTPEKAATGHGKGKTGDGATQEKIETPEAFRRELGAFLDAYLSFVEALARDDGKGAKEAVTQMKKRLSEVNMALLSGEAHVAWMRGAEELDRTLRQAQKAGDLSEFRSALAPLSDTLTGILETFGYERKAPVYRMFCPMAFDAKGANWLQREKKVANPYFGKKMPDCGAEKGAIPLRGGTP